MNSIRLMIFDLDGTLLNTLGDIAAAGNYAMRKLGQPVHPVEDYKMMVGEGADVLVRRALPADRQELADEALRLFKTYYEAHPHDTTAPYPGIAELLDGLTSSGVKLAVHTNKPQSVAEVVVRQFFGAWTWTAIAGHRQGVPKKPAPTAALAIARTAGVPPAECGFLGDSWIDMQTATAAGMIPLGALWGFRDRKELAAHGAQTVVESPCDLLRQLRVPLVGSATSVRDR